ncbi:hypothetical protein [Streptomyces sp. NBC_01462]|uniref:hypothetical protein n=1 Tax=Streptomyces sp. NBC_01462 TaxID=2903876 RepID=UPI002E3016D7|nr:hypothetical protein [Streptomyces sp. NBC_01462]
MCNFDVPENQKGELWAVSNPFIGSQAYTDIWTSDFARAAHRRPVEAADVDGSGRGV